MSRRPALMPTVRLSTMARLTQRWLTTVSTAMPTVASNPASPKVRPVPATNAAFTSKANSSPPIRCPAPISERPRRANRMAFMARAMSSAKAKPAMRSCQACACQATVRNRGKMSSERTTKTTARRKTFRACAAATAASGVRVSVGKTGAVGMAGAGLIILTLRWD